MVFKLKSIGDKNVRGGVNVGSRFKSHGCWPSFGTAGLESQGIVEEVGDNFLFQDSLPWNRKGRTKLLFDGEEVGVRELARALVRERAVVVVFAED